MPYIGAGIQRFNTANTADSLTVNGDAQVTGTVNPSGDTASGDAAAVGFTSTEGLILTGQGSTSDITLKNDADATVFSVPTGTDDILFPDNAKSIFGAGSDLQIFHDGSHSRIAEAGTGDLKIGTSGGAVRITANGVTDDMIVANQGGAVSLAHSGSTKIATASTGVSITGGFTATDACTITTADNNAQLILVSTDNDATSGPEMQLYRNSASPADNDGVGQIQFRGNNDAAQEISYAEIDVLMRDVSDGTENGEIRLLVTRNGTSREAISLSGTDVVFNEGSEDIDFRVESNGNANMLFVDGGNDRVGIGTNSPAVELDIAGSGEMLHLSSTDTNKASIVGKGSSADRWKLGTLDSNDSVTLQASNSTGELIFETGGATERARISSGGRMSIGTTSTSFRFNVVSDQSDYVAQFDRNVDIDGNFRNHIKFSRGGTAVGEILTSQSATQYGTSSDHRLKENVEGMTGAIARVKQLSPKRFSWIVDDLDAPNFDGFLAHEAQAIVPQAVSGTHDNVDEDGNPVMQGIDHSMMVPLLTGALQEAIAEIETLKTKVAALEGE